MKISMNNIFSRKTKEMKTHYTRQLLFSPNTFCGSQSYLQCMFMVSLMEVGGGVVEAAVLPLKFSQLLLHYNLEGQDLRLLL